MAVVPTAGNEQTFISHVSRAEQAIRDISFVKVYTDIYYEHVDLLSRYPVDFEAAQSSPPHKLYLTALAAVGAQSSAHHQVANLLLESARFQLAALFEQTDFFVAAAYGVLSGFHVSAGSFETASVLNSTACAMADQLALRQQDDWQTPNVDETQSLADLQLVISQSRVRESLATIAVAL